MLAAAAAKSRGDTSGGQEGLQPNESEPAEGNDAECEEEEDPVEDDPPQDVQDVEQIELPDTVQDRDTSGATKKLAVCWQRQIWSALFEIN